MEVNPFVFNPVIVIGREFGSGGRTIGKMIADRLGYAYYDTELLSEASKRLGYRGELFERHDESPPSLLRSLVQGIYGIADNFHSVAFGSERLYSEQSKVIKDLCERSPCVFVGRTADFILKDHPLLVSVFLHSPVEKRASRILERGEATNIEEAIRIAKKKDRDRERYYNYFTASQNWGKASNYSLTIDSSTMTNEEITEMIIKCLEIKIQK